MADPLHYFTVYGGCQSVERWRRDNPDMRLDLDGANLRDLDLSGMDLSYASLRGALLTRTKLTGAKLDCADLDNSNIIGADLDSATLNRASLSWAKLTGANCKAARLREANMIASELSHAVLTGADLFGANLLHTNFVDGGVDACGDDFRATWAEGGGSLEIRYRYDMWTSFEDAFAACDDAGKHYDNPPAIRLKLNYMRDQYWLRIKQAEAR